MQVYDYKTKAVEQRPTISLILLAVMLLHLTACSHKEESPAVLERLGWVSDYADVLSPAANSRISATLESFERKTCHQVFLLIIPTLAGEDIAAFSKRTASGWKIGYPGLDNGLLVSVVMDEGAVRIETGPTFEWLINDGVADKALKEVMFPLFRQDRIAEGLELGLAEIMEAARQQTIPAGQRPALCRQ